MEYRDRTTEEVLDYAQLKEARPSNYIPPNPSTEYLNDLDVDFVRETLPPAVTETQQAIRDGVKQHAGEWFYAWKVVAKPVDEVAAMLLAAKTAKNDEINAARLAANLSSFPYAGQQIACDTLSRSDIDGINGSVLLLGALPPGWPGGWKTLANTYVPITTVAQWTAFYMAMIAQGQANFARSQTHKVHLAEAVTLASVEAIQW